MAEEHDFAFRRYMVTLGGPLRGEAGEELLQHLRLQFVERRRDVTEEMLGPDEKKYPLRLIKRVSSYSSDPLEMARNEGRREVVLYLQDLQEMKG